MRNACETLTRRGSCMVLPVISLLFWAFVRLSSAAPEKRTGCTRPHLSAPSGLAFPRQIFAKACALPLAGRVSFSAIPKHPIATSATSSNHREWFCTLPSAVAGNRNPHYATAWPTDAVNVGNTLHGRAIVSPRVGPSTTCTQEVFACQTITAQKLSPVTKGVRQLDRTRH